MPQRVASPFALYCVNRAYQLVLVWNKTRAHTILLEMTYFYWLRGTMWLLSLSRSLRNSSVVISFLGFCSGAAERKLTLVPVLVAEKLHLRHHAIPGFLPLCMFKRCTFPILGPEC